MRLAAGEQVRAAAVVIATGARYRKLALPNYDRYEGTGMHYAATAIEAQLCGGGEVIVIDDGNPAVQVAVSLSRTARPVHVVVRGAGLAATMSDHLI